MNHWWWLRFLDLAAIFWWGFVAVAGLLAAAVIGVNLHALSKKEPPGL